MSMGAYGLLKTAVHYLIYCMQHSDPTITCDTQITIKHTRMNAGLFPSTHAFSSVPAGCTMQQ